MVRSRAESIKGPSTWRSAHCAGLKTVTPEAKVGTLRYGLLMNLARDRGLMSEIDAGERTRDLAFVIFALPAWFLAGKQGENGPPQYAQGKGTWWAGTQASPSNQPPSRRGAKVGPTGDSAARRRQYASGTLVFSEL